MPITSVSAPARDERTSELRLGLVLYGGVSLAIYMHGVTKELLRLVVASRALAEDPDADPFPDGSVERAYVEVLAERRRQTGEQLQVAVDVIAGTSAGGINGVCLAKALAGNLSIESVLDVWLDVGDVDRLIVVPEKDGRIWDPLEARLVGLLGPLRKAGLSPTARRKAALWAVRSARGHPDRAARPPLDGDLMFREVKRALDAMDGARLSQAPTLMPDGLPMDLFVTTTDFYGYDHSVPVNDPVHVLDRRHRHVLTFSGSGATGSLGAAHNPELAFAARATSCFPGAFPPISLANIAENLDAAWPGLDGFVQRCFPIYALSRADAERAWFVDGGVLDNYPFRLAMDAIRRKGAATRVDRRLVYVEPSPAAAPAPGAEGNAAASMPGILQTVWGGLSALPTQEPILDDLQEQHERNVRLRRIGEALRGAEPQVAARVGAAPPPAELSAASTRLAEDAASSFGYVGYARLKLLAVVDGIATAASTACGYPPESAHARFVADTLHAWAAARGLLAAGDRLTGDQLAFLRSFDVGYAERRIRALVALINELYGRDGLEKPGRADLNEAKRQLYERGLELTRALQAAIADPLVQRTLRAAFVDGLDQRLFADGGPARLAEEHGEQLDAARTALAASLEASLGDFGTRTYAVVDELVDRCDEAVAREVATRYLGFPFWDFLTFPLRAAGDLGELDPVEIVRMSPQDVRLLTWPGRAEHQPKLQGVHTHHFAAFFQRSWRENDYLWGRLDTAERLVHLLLPGAPPALPAAIFAAILREERAAGKLREVGDLFSALDGQVRALQSDV